MKIFINLKEDKIQHKYNVVRMAKILVDRVTDLVYSYTIFLFITSRALGAVMISESEQTSRESEPRSRWLIVDVTPQRARFDSRPVGFWWKKGH
jgi:hypothetical protein